MGGYDTLAFCPAALTTEKPTPDLLRTRPHGLDEPLISVRMWRFIATSAAYQCFWLFLVYYGGPARLDAYAADDERVTSMVFNTFVWCQLFNMLNARKVDDSFGVLSGMRRSYTFVAIWCGIAGFQVVIMCFLGGVFDVVRPRGAEWAVAVAVGAGQLAWCAAVKVLGHAWGHAWDLRRARDDLKSRNSRLSAASRAISSADLEAGCTQKAPQNSR